MSDAQIFGIAYFVILVALLILISWACNKATKRNRRVNLPEPRPDSRNWSRDFAALNLRYPDV